MSADTGDRAVACATCAKTLSLQSFLRKGVSLGYVGSI
jgi:hypothetical protein